VTNDGSFEQVDKPCTVHGARVTSSIQQQA
jgi:hypothetical protein